MNYNWYEDRRIYLERELDDLEEQRDYLATDEAREVMIEVAIDSPFYNTLSAEAQTDYINNQIDADQDMFERQIQEMSGDLEVVRTVMSTWNEPAPAAGADHSSRSVSTDSAFDEGAFTRVPMSRTHATIERPVLRRGGPVRPRDLILPPYAPDSPPYAPDSPPYAPDSPIGPPPGWGDISTDSTIMQDVNNNDDSLHLSDLELSLESPEAIEIIDVDPSPPGSPERTPPPRRPHTPSAPSRPSRGVPSRRGGTKKAKQKRKKGKTNKRNTTKKTKRKGKKQTTAKKRK